MKTTASGTDLRAHIAELIGMALAAAWPQSAGAATVVIERPKQVQHGDYASSVALQLAKILKRKPRDIADALVAALPPSPWVGKAEVAGAGFINFFLTPQAHQAAVTRVLAEGAAYGRDA